MTLIKNIGELVGIVPTGVLRKQGAEMAETGVLKDAWLAIEDGKIAGFGKMADLVGHDGPGTGSSVIPGSDTSVIPGSDRESIDAQGGMVLPAFCDSHTHIVYAGSRDGEFLDKINGLSYEEIAARGGGILNSSDLLHETSEDELFEQSMARVREMMGKGTGAIEIKSGYGLNPADELKMLRVIRHIKESVPALVRVTFLGAHAVGRGYTHEGYVQAMVDMMPQVAEYADFVDVFCDEGFFTVEDTDRILTAGAACGLRPKIHANELAVSGGVQVGVKHGALSVDHLERTTDAEIEVLRGSETMPTMLPGSSFFLGIPFGRAKEFIGAGLGIALALRRHALRDGPRLHPHAPHPRPGPERRHPEQRLCHGPERHHRLHHPRQARRPPPHPPRLDLDQTPLSLPDSFPPDSLPERPAAGITSPGARTGPSAGPIQAKTPSKCPYRSCTWTCTGTGRPRNLSHIHAIPTFCISLCCTILQRLIVQTAEL